MSRCRFRCGCRCRRRRKFGGRVVNKRLHDDELADAARTSELGCALVPRVLRELSPAGDACGVRAVDLVLRPLRLGPIALFTAEVGCQAVARRPPTEAAIAPVALRAGEHGARPHRHVPVHTGGRQASWDGLAGRAGRIKQVDEWRRWVV
jgi:hypothetical protein